MAAVSRDSNGRFTPGHPGGPGRPPRAIEDEYLRAMASVVDAEAWESIIKKATEQAINGDSKARTFLASYLLGQPIARVADEGSKGKAASMVARLEALQLGDEPWNLSDDDEGELSP